MMQPIGFVIMGVSGCGKSTIARAIADRLGWQYFDADDFHPPANIAKMANGIPLDDADRAPWLLALQGQLHATLQMGGHPVLACSALKERYRQTLLAGNEGIQLVYLRGSYDLIWSRMAARPGHYMKPAMLQSQFAALEEPVDALVVEIIDEPDEMVIKILQAFQLLTS